MELHEETIGPVVLIAPRGRLDSSTSPLLADRLLRVLDAAPQGLLLDFERLEYISSAGFRVLLIAGKKAASGGTVLRLCALSPKVQQLFDLGGFADLLPTHGNRGEALAAHGAAGPA